MKKPQITATIELERFIRTVKAAGCPMDQIKRFIAAGYFPQPVQLAFHAAARAADHPANPNHIACGGDRAGAKSHAVFAQVVIDDCQRFPGLDVLYLRKVGKAARKALTYTNDFNHGTTRSTGTFPACLAKRCPGRWSNAPHKEAKPVNEQLIQAIQEWLEEHDLMTQLSKAAYHMLWSSRGPLRVYIPETELVNGVVPPSEFADALLRIRVEALHPAQATLAHYGQVGIYTYQDSEEEDVAELTYLDEAGQTIIRSTAEGATEAIIPMGSRLTMFEMRREPIITESLRTLQRKLNHAATAENANLAQAGWITRLFMNGRYMCVRNR